MQSGRERASTTLNLYTHRQDDYDRRILAAFDDGADFPPTETGELDTSEDSKNEEDSA